MTPVSITFPHDRTTIIIKMGKAKEGKRNAIPEDSFLMFPHAYVTGTVPGGYVV